MEIIDSVQSNQNIYKIAYIDDSLLMLNMIKDYLETEKYQAFTVKDPMKCLPCLFDSKPDLILMNFLMPGINGNRLYQILKKSSAFEPTPIIMVSGNSNMLYEDIRACGASDYLCKPFTRESLLAMVEKYLCKTLA
jgi:twitching motility two-component system response regulator PilG